MKDIEAKAKARAFRIGGVVIDPPLVLAPMAGVTNVAFRRLCKRAGGCGLVCAEMVSSYGLHYHNSRTGELLVMSDEERPVSVQLFGALPEVMADAARKVEEAGADIIDVNIGCPVPKVVKTGAAGALLKDLDLAEHIIRAVVGAVRVPVTVKTRAGWNAEHVTAVELAVRARDAGAAAIVVHGRTVSQGFSGRADWTVIRKVKETVTIPVIGNGDVRTPQDAARMFDETNCDGVMVGRGALGNPWIFRAIDSYLKTGELLPDPSCEDRTEAAWRHALLLASIMDEKQAVRELRGQLAWYIKGRSGASEMRGRLSKASTLDEIRSILYETSS
ncbi:MAG: tRNA dihydrouridine synthase DusB [Armatimonadota bacterium]|nr:tRNA dihydrouridine synthase DusB [Armatimonadota bacterium]